MFETIERLKQQWTDKLVVIDSPAPELARFAQATGVVKTVNMNGRCLVEFDQYNNVGWYDIDPAALRIVTEPLPKPAAKATPAKPAAKAAAKPAAAKPAAAKPAAAPAAGAKRPSTADILAAARGKAGAAPAAKPAAGGKPSTADILAMARAKQAAAAAAEPVASPEPEPTPEPAVPAPPLRAGATAKAGGPLPTTTAEKIAWCRTHDAKG